MSKRRPFGRRLLFVQVLKSLCVHVFRVLQDLHGQIVLGDAGLIAPFRDDVRRFLQFAQDLEYAVHLGDVFLTIDGDSGKHLTQDCKHITLQVLASLPLATGWELRQGS